MAYSISGVPLFHKADLDAVRIAGVRDIRRAAQALHDIAMGVAGLRAAPTHDIADKRTPVDADGAILAHDVFGWGDADGVWWKNSRIALDSPITSACRFESDPFWVNADGFVTRLPNPYLGDIDLSNFEHRALTWAAIVVPVHLPFGQIGVVTFNPVERAHRDLSQEFEIFGDMLGAYAQIFIASYVQVMGSHQRLRAGSNLSVREVECLRWAAIGKTDYEIGLILSRSRATVRFHIHNAAMKLDAVNRSQAVFKAAQLGYLSLG